ncbi:MAG: hypothetical protein AB1521_11265 [Bacteroidota bacterium]
MKAVIRISVLVVTFIVFLIGCENTSAGGNTKNEYLGEYPSLLKSYSAKMGKMEADIKSKKAAKDVDALLKLAKEKKELEKEFKTKIDEYSKSYKFSKPIQLQAAEGSPLKINGVKVKAATSDALSFEIDAILNKDIKTEYGGFERILVVYFKAVDTKGNVIPKSYTNASRTNTDMKAGTALNLAVAWNNERAQSFENFAKLIQVTEAEYNKNK